LKISANLSDLADAASSRSNLGVDSSAEVDSKVSSAVSSAQDTLQTSIDGVSGRVTTLEGQNLDSRLSSAEGTIAGLGTMSTQDANNVSITGGSIGAGSVPTDSGVILTENSTLDGGTFSGNGGGGSGLSISVQPQSMTWTSGDENPVFSVTASGSGSLSYQWYRNGAAYGTILLIGETAPSVREVGPASENGATYWVVVTDSNGSLESAHATLTVI
jgi:hypothetical protein